MADWVATDPAKKLYIEFTEEPFEGMQLQQDSGRFRVRCNGHRCDSGEILANAGAKEYKYWQILEDRNGVRDEVDGMIIIVP